MARMMTPSMLVPQSRCTLVSVRPRMARSMPVSRTNVLSAKAELKVGGKLEDFPDSYRVLKGNDNKTYTLASYKGKQPLVLFFYPKASTPGCTKEACKFRDEYARFVDAGAAVFGISSDDVSTNNAFAQSQRLPYPLLTDTNTILRKTFGIKGDMMGLLPGRQTFVFDKSGKCILAFNDQFQAEKHVEMALKALQGAAV